MVRRALSVHEALGYWINRPYWGPGFATEGRRDVINFTQRRGNRSGEDAARPMCKGRSTAPP